MLAFGPPPNPRGALDPKLGTAEDGSEETLGLGLGGEESLGGEGLTGGMGRYDDEPDGVIGMEARGGLGGLAGGTEPGIWRGDGEAEEVWLCWKRLSISSMSDCEDACTDISSLPSSSFVSLSLSGFSLTFSL